MKPLGEVISQQGVKYDEDTQLYIPSQFSLKTKSLTLRLSPSDRDAPFWVCAQAALTWLDEQLTRSCD